MKIVEPYARILPPPTSCDAAGSVPRTSFELLDGIDLLRRIEFCGRISHRSEDAQTLDSYDRFIRAVVVGHGDWSIVEHASVSAEILVDRGIQTEIVRHRLASYTIESTRFVNYEKKMPASFVKPDDISPAAYGHWEHAIENCEQWYRDMLAHGCAPQIARDVFPLALAGLIVMTCNLRQWRHFFIMRSTKEAHPKMRRVVIPLLEEFKNKIPILFEDLEPLARQVDNLKKAR